MEKDCEYYRKVLSKVYTKKLEESRDPCKRGIDEFEVTRFKHRDIKKVM